MLRSLALQTVAGVLVRLDSALVRIGMVAALVLGSAAPALAQGALDLTSSEPSVDAWSAVTLLVDAGSDASIDDVLARSPEFTAPPRWHANLGVRRDAVWLRVPLRVDAADDGRWIANIDYPSLDRIDLYVVADGVPLQQVALGDHLPYNARPLASRSHAVRLQFEPGRRYVLYARVQTRSSMIVPLRLVKEDRFYAEEMNVQMAQGLVAGLALCLALYALAQFAGCRDPMFLYYAMTLLGVGMFFFAYYGLAPQHLWSNHAWLTDNAAPMLILIGVAGAMLLVERLLDIRAHSRRLALTLQVLSVVALVASVLFVADVIDYRAASLVGTILGPMPIVLGVHLAWRKARVGDEAARYVLIGWTAYAVGVLVMAALLRGMADSNIWTQHAFQAGWIIESIAWMRVLGVRAGEIRRQAARAIDERALLTRLAHTDPLTGLPNRRGLDLALQAALAQVNPGRGLAVYVVDLDGFKAVNDRLGHDAGDELLVGAAQRLSARLRGADVVARLGGDEFVVLANQLSDESVAWRLGQKLLDAFAEPFVIQGQPCKVGLTVGFALSPQDGLSASDLLKRADAAMYAGKEGGKGTVRRGGASTGLVSA